MFKRDNVNVHRAAANTIVSKSRAARGSACNVLLSRVSLLLGRPVKVAGIEIDIVRVSLASCYVIQVNFSMLPLPVSSAREFLHCNGLLSHSHDSADMEST